MIRSDLNSCCVKRRARYGPLSLVFPFDGKNLPPLPPCVISPHFDPKGLADEIRPRTHFFSSVNPTNSPLRSARVSVSYTHRGHFHHLLTNPAGHAVETANARNSADKGRRACVRRFRVRDPDGRTAIARCARQRQTLLELPGRARGPSRLLSPAAGASGPRGLVVYARR